MENPTPWDYQNDLEYLRGENEFLKDNYYRLLDDVTELQRLAEMSPERRTEVRRAFQEEMAQHQRQLDEVRAEVSKTEEELVATKLHLDRDIQAALAKYEHLIQKAKTTEEQVEARKRVSAEYTTQVLKSRTALLLN